MSIVVSQPAAKPRVSRFPDLAGTGSIIIDDAILNYFLKLTVTAVHKERVRNSQSFFVRRKRKGYCVKGFFQQNILSVWSSPI